MTTKDFVRLFYAVVSILILKYMDYPTAENIFSEVASRIFLMGLAITYLIMYILHITKGVIIWIDKKG